MTRTNRTNLGRSHDESALASALCGCRRSAGAVSAAPKPEGTAIIGSGSALGIPQFDINAQAQKFSTNASGYVHVSTSSGTELYGIVTCLAYVRGVATASGYIGDGLTVPAGVVGFSLDATDYYPESYDQIELRLYDYVPAADACTRLSDLPQSTTTSGDVVVYPGKKIK